MMTKQELSSEFWLLTVGVLQDARVDLEEAKVIKRWLEEHREAGDFGSLIEKLDGYLSDGFIDPNESARITSMIGMTLRMLRSQS